MDADSRASGAHPRRGRRAAPRPTSSPLSAAAAELPAGGGARGRCGRKWRVRRWGRRGCEGGYGEVGYGEGGANGGPERSTSRCTSCRTTCSQFFRLRRAARKRARVEVARAIKAAVPSGHSALRIRKALHLEGHPLVVLGIGRPFAKQLGALDSVSARPVRGVQHSGLGIREAVAARRWRPRRWRPRRWRPRRRRPRRRQRQMSPLPWRQMSPLPWMQALDDAYATEGMPCTQGS